MSGLVCEALATKAELQELRDQINQLLGQPEEEEEGNNGLPIDVLALGAFAGTAIGRNFTLAKESIQTIELAGTVADDIGQALASGKAQWVQVKGSGAVKKLPNLTKLGKQTASRAATATKAAAITGASLAGIFSVLSTLLSIFVTTKQNELNGLILNNMEREAAARDLDYERLIKIAGKQQENIDTANTRITEMNIEIADAKIANEQLGNDLERASEYIEQLREGLGEQAEWINDALEYIDDLKLDFKEYQTETTEDITTLQTTVDDLEVKLEESFTYSDAEGNPIDVAEWLTNKITGIVKGIIGAQTFAELSLKLTAANRIYQAGMNILDNVTDLMDTAIDLDEYTGENIAKIGNALRQSGVVSYNAYEQMIEELDVRGRSKWLFKLEQAEDAVDNLYSIADSIRDIKEIGQDLKESREEFKEALETEKTTLSESETELEAEIESSPEPTEQDEARG